jgi:hypothetical protein
MLPRSRSAARALLVLLAIPACAQDPEQPPPTSGSGGGRDARPVDVRSMDMASLDTPVSIPVDAGPVDAAASEAPPVDAAIPDAPPVDAPGADVPPAVGQIPPQGRRFLDPWLAAGHYKTWRCEVGAMNPRAGSPHGRVRICSNDLASRHGSGPYPVGAASVKEIYYGNRIGVFAVSVKVAPGTGGSSWYWYEQNDMEGVGAPGCAGCHSRADRQGGNDHVYIQVQ